ncbi:hypothetical protein B9Z19DRAFT_744017 [Tuber borchii]|uniref:Transmembrane protein n=1 Tax=Tuber borchii TaxID=42251 RepID=A0A2T6ZXK8_TUBBO|nr:hypothetical protein B9Z19DRAFT_744017 [Tuber borchii]
MADNQKASIKGSNEGEERGSHESDFGERNSTGSDEVELPGPSHEGAGCEVGDGGVSKLQSPPSVVQPPGEMSYAQAAAPESCTDQFRRDAKGEGDSGDRAEAMEKGEKGPGGRVTDTPYTKGTPDTTVGCQPGEISVIVGRTGSPSSPETKELRPIKLQPEDIGGFGMDDTQSPITKGMSTGGGEIIEALKVSDQNGGEDVAAKGESRAEEPTGSEDVSKSSGGIRGALKADEEVINGKKHEKLLAKRVSFAPELSESNSGEKSTTSPETKELEKVADAPGEFGYNIGTFKGHDEAIDEKQRGQLAEEKSQSAQKPRESTRTEELRKIASASSEFGSNAGTAKGHDRTTDEKRHNQSAEREPDPAQQPRPNHETEELERMADVVGESGYNVGDQPNSHPGRHETRGADPRGQRTVAGLRASAEVSEGQRPNDASTPPPAAQSQSTNGTAESKKFGSTTIERAGDDNSGRFPSSHLDRHNAHRQNSSGRSQGGEGIAPEAEELGRITMDSGEFGYNVGGLPSSHPDKHRRHSHGRLQYQAGQETSESHELGQIKYSNGEFGYSVGGLEQRRRGKEKESPTVSESRRRNKEPTKEGYTSNMRDSGYYGHSDGEDSHFTQTKESQQESPFIQCTPGHSATSDIPQSYLHSFISYSPSGPTSPPQLGHVTEVIELESPATPPCHQSQTITIHELRTVLADFKSDLITSITTEFRLQKTELDLDRIRKPLPRTPRVGIDEHHPNRDVEVEFVKAEAYPYPEEVKAAEKGMERMAVWGIIGVAVVIALGFIMLGRSGNVAIRLGFSEGLDWLDKLAGWLFKEGKKGSS